MKDKRNIMKLLGLICLIVVLATGCGMDRLTNDELRSLSEKNAMQQIGNRNSEGVVDEKHLARIAEQVIGVEHAVVSMDGSEVVVGIQIDNETKRRILEQQVYSALLWQFPKYQYHVTADESFYMKISAGENMSPMLDAIDRSFMRE